mmetsp:Transcript_44167/g.86667  ORF Transcript_44167/g.86667 Transcript_44167/m.86667 type:complete len:352 (-) Transcript_44167:234-1289(-)
MRRAAVVRRRPSTGSTCPTTPPFSRGRTTASACAVPPPPTTASGFGTFPPSPCRTAPVWTCRTSRRWRPCAPTGTPGISYRGAIPPATWAGGRPRDPSPLLPPLPLPHRPPPPPSPRRSARTSAGWRPWWPTNGTTPPTPCGSGPWRSTAATKRAASGPVPAVPSKNICRTTSISSGGRCPTTTTAATRAGARHGTPPRPPPPRHPRAIPSSATSTPPPARRRGARDARRCICAARAAPSPASRGSTRHARCWPGGGGGAGSTPCCCFGRCAAWDTGVGGWWTGATTCGRRSGWQTRRGRGDAGSIWIPARPRWIGRCCIRSGGRSRCILWRLRGQRKRAQTTTKTCWWRT